MDDLFTTAEQACRLRDIGLDRVESSNYDYAFQASKVALQLAATEGEVTSDSLQQTLPRPDFVAKNTIGAIFGGLVRRKKLKIVGYTQSLRESAHYRRIAVYAQVT